MMTLAPVFASLGRAGKKKTLKTHKKSRFQPNEKIFAESCLVLYKDLLRAKEIFGVIGVRSKHLFISAISFLPYEYSCPFCVKYLRLNLVIFSVVSMSYFRLKQIWKFRFI